VKIPPHPSEEQLAELARQFPGSALVYEEWMNLLGGARRARSGGARGGRGVARPSPALEKAQFEVAAASMRGDAAGRLTAVAAAARAWPGDAPLQVQAGEGLNQARRFREAIPFFRAARRAEPANFRIYGSLCLTQAMAGEKPDLRRAQAAAEHELTGDVAYLRGEFAAAEAAYLKAAEMDNSTPPGKVYAKAAEAALLQNQIARADGYMQRYFAAAGNDVVRGLWLWRTGRRAEALRQAAGVPGGEAAVCVFGQSGGRWPAPIGPALQALAQGRAAEAAEALAGFIGQQPLPVGLALGTGKSAGAGQAGKQSEACALLAHWGLPSPPDDWSGAVFWPRSLAVRAACLEKADAARAKQLRALVEALQPR
jgi:tetratricopeptide (TPR) repeat protein